MIQMKHRFWLGVCVLFLMLTGNLWALSDTAPQLPEGEPLLAATCMVPFKLCNNNIFVTARINDDPTEYRFLVDTGAPNVVSAKVAAALRLEKVTELTAVDSAGNSQATRLVSIKKLRLGDATVNNSFALVNDFQTFAKIGLEIDGFIGSNFLKFFKVTIDYQLQQLTFAQSTGKTAGPGAVITLAMNDIGQIHTLGNIPGSAQPLPLQIDTGASGNCYLLVPETLYQQMPEAFSETVINCLGRQSSGLFGQSAVSRITRIKKLQIGGLNLQNLPVQVTGGNMVNLCNRFLTHFTVTIDYPAATLRLIPNPNAPISDNLLSYGFAYGQNETGQPEIEFIWENSPAAKAGVKPGDRIAKLAAAGKDLPFAEWYSAISNPEITMLQLSVANSSGIKNLILKKALLLQAVKPE